MTSKTNEPRLTAIDITDHREINKRMSEIGAEFGKNRFGDPPNWQALRAEYNYLQKIYRGVLESAGAKK